MRQKVFLMLGLAVLILILVGLNVVSYQQKETEPDTEIAPNRSTFNLGSTGTRAFYQFLVESGRRAVRWQKPVAELLSDEKSKPSTFVIVGTTRREIPEADASKILDWVANGGKLVLIDREPDQFLVQATGSWTLTFESSDKQPAITTDASDSVAMTKGAVAAKPVQPTIFTKSVNSVQTSAFASSIKFYRVRETDEGDAKAKASPDFFPVDEGTPLPKAFPTPFKTPPPKVKRSGHGGDIESAPVVNGPPLIRKETGLGSSSGTPTPKQVIVKEEDKTSVEITAPVTHFAAERKDIVVEVPYGLGRIVMVSDPYIVSNGGIALADNLTMAVNVVAAGDGIIAFDEYHQGYGVNDNHLLEFFAGTPVMPVFLQLALLVLVIFFSQSRRFARAVPEPEPNRLSKLEYVSAMAELQQRTKGFDLAIENIYTDFRRRVSRLVGVDALHVRKQDLAMLIWERVPTEDPVELERLMQRCEDVMHGDASNKREVLKLTTRLRQIEEKLGLQRRKKRNN